MRYFSTPSSIYRSLKKPETLEEIREAIKFRKIKGDFLKTELQNMIHKMPSESIVNGMLEEYNSFHNQFESLRIAVIKFYINECSAADKIGSEYIESLGGKKPPIFIQTQFIQTQSSYANINVGYQTMVTLQEISKWRDELYQNKNKPLSERQRINNKATLIRLREVCSRLEQGLTFVAGKGATFQCDMWSHTGQKESVSYDMKAHKENMKGLNKMVPMLKGAGLRALGISLVILAQVMLAAFVILSTIPSVGTSIPFTLLGASFFSTGVGFCLGENRKVACATSKAEDALISKDLDLREMDLSLSC